MCRRFSHLARTSRPVPASHDKSEPVGLCTELCPSPNLRPTSDRRPRSALKAATDHSLRHLPFFLLFEFVPVMADAWPPGRKPAKHTQGNSDNATKYRVGLGLAGGWPLGGRAETTGHSADDEPPLEPEPSKSLPPQGDPADTSIARSLPTKGTNRCSERARVSRKTTRQERDKGPCPTVPSSTSGADSRSRPRLNKWPP